ncbi:MAG: adenine phosphoribosyltransferase [Planctomycetales bacterium]|nr:adenine phosphoribosyltransferase [Planctomycetales bacterium]
MPIDLKRFVRDIPDFPKPGILYRDIAPLLLDPTAFKAATEAMAAPFAGQKIDVIAAAEARGFIFAGPMAQQLGVGFVPIRKPGKLPFDTHSHAYDLEYGSDELHVHIDGVLPGQRVVIVDDLLATGGTMQACCRLLERCEAEIVGCSFLIHLADLQGEKKLEPYRVESALVY